MKIGILKSHHGIDLVFSQHYTTTRFVHLWVNKNAQQLVVRIRALECGNMTSINSRSLKTIGCSSFGSTLGRSRYSSYNDSLLTAGFYLLLMLWNYMNYSYWVSGQTCSMSLFAPSQGPFLSLLASLESNSLAMKHFDISRYALWFPLSNGNNLRCHDHALGGTWSIGVYLSNLRIIVLSMEEVEVEIIHFWYISKSLLGADSTRCVY